MGYTGFSEAGIVVAIAICSPAVMFALERGNIDVVLFSVLVMGVLVSRRERSVSQMLTPAIMLQAAVGKLHPVFALPACVLFGARRAAIATWLFGVAFMAYLVNTYKDILIIAGTATQGQYYSYGARIPVGCRVPPVVGRNWEGEPLVAQAIALAIVIVLGACFWVWSRRGLAPIPGVEPHMSTEQLSFYTGALICVGTLMVFKNYDYRLVYLLLTLPQLFVWANPAHQERPRQILASLSLGVLVLALFTGAISESLLLLDQLVSWTLAGLLVVVLAASVPRVEVIGRWRRAGSSTHRTVITILRQQKASA